MPIFELPLKVSSPGDTLEIDTEELPEPEDLVEILNSEEADSSFFITLAFAYSQQNSDPSHLFDKCPKDVVYYNFKALEAVESDKYIEATSLLNKADELNPKFACLFYTKALLLFKQKDIHGALNLLNMQVLSDHVPSLLIKGNCYYSSQKYAEALEAYQNAFQYDPSSKSKHAIDIRKSIGLCFVQLNMQEEAFTAFTKVLELKPDDSDSLAIVGQIHLYNFRQNADVAEFQQALNLFKQSHQIDGNAIACINLCEFLFQKKQVDKSLTLAQRALENCKDRISQSEAFYCIGRAYHLKRDLKEARKNYQQSIELNENNYRSLFGLAQTKIQLAGDMNEVVKLLESIQKDNIDSHEVLGMLGILAARTDDAKRAHDLLIRSSEMDPTNVNVHLELTEILLKCYVVGAFTQRMEGWKGMEYITDALHCLQAAVKVMNSTGIEIPLGVYNNLGVLLYHSKDIDSARRMFEQVVKSDDEVAKITSLYNMARIYEESGSKEEAKDIYQHIVDQAQNYYDAMIRLGALSFGSIAEDWFKDIFTYDDMNLDAWSYLARTQLETQQMRNGRKAFEKILDFNSKDAYALTALGFVWLTSVLEKKKRDGSLPKEAMKELTKSCEYFDRASRADPRNSYALNGYGIALSLIGQKKAAKQVFTQIRESDGSEPIFLMNLAHASLDLGDPNDAIVHYQKYAERCGESAYTNQCLSKAYYVLGKAEKDVGGMMQSLLHAEKAHHFDPNDTSLIFNVALILQQYAQLCWEMPAEKRDLHTLANALKSLDRSQELFTSLQQKSANAKHDRHMASQRKNYGESLKTKIAKLYDETQASVNEQEERARQIRDRKLQQEMEQRKREEERILEKEKMRAEVEEMRKVLKEKADTIIRTELEDKAEEGEQPKKKRGRKKKRKEENEMEIEEEEQVDVRDNPAMGEAENDEEITLKVEQEDLMNIDEEQEIKPSKGRPALIADSDEESK